MMKHEFERIAGYEVSVEDYDNIIEPMYSATNVSKTEFVKMISRKRFEVKQEEQKMIKVLNVTDRCGSLWTPNRCYRHLVDVEVVRIDIGTGKVIVKVIPDTYRLGYSADFTIYDRNIEVIGA